MPLFHVPTFCTALCLASIGGLEQPAANPSYVLLSRGLGLARGQGQLDAPVDEVVGQDVAVARLLDTVDVDVRLAGLAADAPDSLVVDGLEEPCGC